MPEMWGDHTLREDDMQPPCVVYAVDFSRITKGAVMSRRLIRNLEAKIAKKQDGILACYEIIAEHQPKLDRMKDELQELRKK